MSLDLGPKFDALVWATATVIFIVVGSVLLAQLARRIAGMTKLSASEQRKVYWGFLFASPWIIGFFIFVVGPSLASLYFSFTNFKLGGTPEWIGLENYRDFLQGSGAAGRRFQQAMYNSAYYAVVGVPLQILAALVMAMLLNTALRGIRVFRLIFYMPVILAGGPAILLAWRYMLSSNGGFINISLKGLGETIPIFDWLYRAFIFSVEVFNGFYAGLTRGDPIGPLKYTIPAFIGVFTLLWLLRADWDKGKRQMVQRVAEVVAIVVGMAILAGGFASDPLPPTLTIVWGLVVTFAIVVNSNLGKAGTVRTWQIVGLGSILSGAIFTLVASSIPAEEGAATTSDYLLALLLAAAPIVATLAGTWNRAKLKVVIGTAGVVFVILLAMIAPGQLDGGRPILIVKYLTFQSALEHPTDADYLKDVYPVDTMSSLWVYGAVIAVLAAIYLVDERDERLRKWLIYGGFLFFLLLMLGSLVDGIRYFQAFEDIALASGKPNFHFALFHNMSAVFPDKNRVPLWLSSELWSKPALILITMWSSGAGMLIFLAALKGVPKSLYEAAEVDGASPIQKFFRITLPMISPAMFYNLVIGFIAALQTFETVYILQNTNTQDSLSSAAYYLYQRTFQQGWIGQGAAISWILAIVIVVLTIIQFRYSDWVHYEA